MKEQLIKDILRNLPYVEEMAVSHIQAYGKQNTKDDFVLQDFVENIKKLPSCLLDNKDKESDLGEQAQKGVDDWKKSLQELPDITLTLDRDVAKILKETALMEDKVNSPSHYNHGEIECIDAIASALSLDELKGFVRGNVIKYLWRANHKEKEAEDLKKARWYLDYLINKLS